MKKHFFKVGVGVFVALMSGSVMANAAAVIMMQQQMENKAREQKNASYQAIKSSLPNVVNDGFSEFPNFFKIGPETRFCKNSEVVFESKCFTEVKETEGVIERVRVINGNGGSSAQDMLDTEYGKGKVSYVGMGLITRPFNISSGQYYDSMIVYYRIIDDKRLSE